MPGFNKINVRAPALRREAFHAEHFGRMQDRLLDFSFEMTKENRTLSAKEAESADISKNAPVTAIAFSALHYAIEHFIGEKEINGKNIAILNPAHCQYGFYLQSDLKANVRTLSLFDQAKRFVVSDRDHFQITDRTGNIVQENSLDVVISNSTLDDHGFLYFLMIEASDNLLATTFKGKIIMDIERILKPGGYFISQYEDFRGYENCLEGYKYWGLLPFPKTSGLATVNVLRK